MKAENYIVSMTALEVALVALILLATATALGAAGGFYLGTRVLEMQTVDNTQEVLNLCNKVVDHEEDRVQGWKASSAVLREENERFKAFLIDIQDRTGMQATVPLRTGAKGGPPSKRKK